ncbi:prepilin peptidase [Streptomyces kasugaensis]|uniref:Prepilin peptidase n=1 Tax=Streptomyces kasugaensis TaxID=1946 RepID=A0A4Q9HUR9_STRKA|nr:A24 family peptidase [Streptomyces kasugaensis]TBO58897.1 prepilin peptidase [Streptomyces kasugaensis]
MLSQLLATLVGLVAGAALRPVVVALAVPAGQPPHITCPACSPQPVPAVSPHVLRPLPPSGRCPNCRGRLCAPWLPELTTAAAFAVVAAGGAVGWYAVAQYWIALLGAGLLLIDSAVQRLPNPLTLAAAVGTLALLTAASARHEAGSLLRAAVVAAAAGGLFTVFAVLGTTGLGDAKLAISLGAVLGWHSWQAAVLALVLTYLLGATAAVLLLLTQRGHRKSTLAFGPFLIIGTLGAALITSS